MQRILTVTEGTFAWRSAQHFDSWRIPAGAMAAMGLDDHAISAYNHAIGLNPNNAKCY